MKFMLILLLLPFYLFPQTLVSDAKQTYSFTYETVVEITSSEDNRTYKMSYLFNPNENYVGMKVNMSDFSEAETDGESIIIMDKGNSIIFVETQGMKMQMFQTMMGEGQTNPMGEMSTYDYSSIKKTGQTKTILGTTCYQYNLSDEKVKMILWVAPEIKLPNWFGQSSKAIDGHIMAYTMTSSEGTMTSTTIAINDHISKIINSQDYKKMF
ncbi:DUF4412 domain-containing protein [Psychroserpens ponticola]|uniref:DUF4412 domain-containing protein n=1 Tax=Psychroserpens ponticola TaxID=2932268 RepID=A0ABY7RXY2_9FLAO|nr:DUF4412 domain-containing protein [Psychroserpens ponticola]WCO01990.1 DUF4412 domain-containing protein [Psychroserpens ponticola]